MTLCIVDDNATVAAQLKLLAKHAGIHHARTFTAPHAALADCLREPPALILLDYHMPGMDGLAFLELLRQNEATRCTPVAMISGWAVDSLRINALRAGAVDVISKPFVAEELKLKLHNLMRCVLGATGPDAGTGLHAADSLDADDPDEEATRQAQEAPDAGTIDALERLVSLRSDRSWQSLARAARYAAAIAKQCGMTRAHCLLLLRAMPLHTLGEVSADSHALNFRNPVTAEERQQLNARSTAWHGVLRGYTSPLLRLAAELAISSLEHWDGSGAPWGLAGDAIPLSGRIAAVANALEAMTGQAAPNGRLFPLTAAAEVIRADDGQQFDPTVVRGLVRCLPELLGINTSLPN